MCRSEEILISNWNCQSLVARAAISGLLTTNKQTIRKGKVMKILSLVLLLMASLAFVLPGCTDNAAPLAGPTDQALSIPSAPSVLGKGVGILHSATGSANVFFEGKPFTFAFTAHEYADLSCKGEYQIYVHAQPPEWGKIHGKVMSLRVYDYLGGKAAVIGTIETKSGFPGFYDAFVVVDNGEGQKSSPDMYTTSIFWTESLSEAQAVWALPPDQVINAIVQEQLSFGNVVTPEQVLIPIEMGNVQVR
jgi:hypothetical protein